MNFSEAFREACSRFNGGSFSALSERDQILVTIWALEGNVSNGGFSQYYFNSSDDLAWFAPTALRRIGAHRTAAITERANALFGEADPPPDWEERYAILCRTKEADENVWDQLDREFYEYPDDIAELLVSYFGLSSST